MKVKRSERLIDITQYLMARPKTLIPLTFFSARYESAKSSISEDLAIVKRTFATRGTGILQTVPGAAGGVRYIPAVSRNFAETFLQTMAARLAEKERLLPGGYVYLSDLLGQPTVLNDIGRLIATQYVRTPVDVVMTVATKGIPIAQATASYLNVPFVIVRRDSKVTEGSTVSVNYVSGSSNRIEKMELSKRSLREGAKVLVVDDFMTGGGPVNGMRTLINAFDAELVGIAAFAEAIFPGKPMVSDYSSLLRVDDVDTDAQTIVANPGNYLEKTTFLEDLTQAVTER